MPIPSEKYNLDYYKDWIQSVEYNQSYGLWEAKLKPNYILQTPNYLRLIQLIKEKVAYEIIMLVAEALNVKPNWIYETAQFRDHTDARAVAALFMKEKFNMSFPEITEFLHYRSNNHSNAHFAIKRATEIDEVKQKVKLVQSRFDILKF